LAAPNTQAIAIPLARVTGSGEEHRASIVPGRAYTFVLADEVNPLMRKVVRCVMVEPAYGCRDLGEHWKACSCCLSPTQQTFPD
jgi:hypothetical protein